MIKTTPEKPLKWQEAKETPKNSGALKALAIVSLFFVILIANDLFLYRLMTSSNRPEARIFNTTSAPDASNDASPENGTPSFFDEERSTSPAPTDLDGTRNETTPLSGEIIGIQNEMSNRVIQRKLHLNRLQTYLSAGRPGKEFFYKLSGVEQFFNSRNKDSASTFVVKGTPFFLHFMILNQNNVDHLAIFLCTYAKVKVYYEMSLINLHGKNDTAHNTTHLFNDINDPCWGWRTFIKQKDVKDLGFIHSDRILAKAYVSILEN